MNLFKSFKQHLYRFFFKKQSKYVLPSLAPFCSGVKSLACYIGYTETH